MAKRNMVLCTYTDDDGEVSLKRLDARYATQDDGGDPATPLFGAVQADQAARDSHKFTLRTLKPRQVICTDATGAFVSKVTVFTPARYIALANGTAVTIYDGEGAAHAATVTGHEGERSMHGRDGA